MYIFKFNAGETGQVGQGPRRDKLVTSDSLATITTANYLSKERIQPQVLYPNDFVDVTYDATSLTEGTNGVFKVSFSGSIPTLAPFVSGNDVLLPVVNNDFAVFSGTTGQIKDAGYSPSDALKNKVVMSSGAQQVNHIAVFSDANGTIQSDPATAFNSGNIQAGTSGTAGYLSSLPPVAARGQFHFVAANSAGNTITQVTHDSMGQSTSFILPDPGVGIARIGVFNEPITTGDRIVLANGIDGALTTMPAFPLSGRTTTFAGGSTSFAFSKPGVTSASNINGNFVSKTNTAFIETIVCTADTITFNFSADPGANTVIQYNGWNEDVN